MQYRQIGFNWKEITMDFVGLPELDPERLGLLSESIAESWRIVAEATEAVMNDIMDEFRVLDAMAELNGDVPQLFSGLQ
jgi:hypothetical protein